MRIGEIIETSTVGFWAESSALHDLPPLGALVSVGVIAFLIAYALAAPTPDLRLEVGHVVPQPGATAVVEGRVIEPDTSGLGGSRIEVRRRGGASGTDICDADGRFRVDLAGSCGTYEVVLRTTWQG